MTGLSTQLVWLFTLAIPVACVAWTVTHEEVFKEPREFCVRNSKEGKTLVVRKFFYLFTCEDCFSHYVTILFLILTGYKLLMEGWRGYVLAGFAVVWVANMYMSIYQLLRVDMKKENTIIKVEEQKLKDL